MSAPNIEGTLNLDIVAGGVNNGSVLGASAETPAGMHGSYCAQATGYGTPAGGSLTASFSGTFADSGNLQVVSGTLAHLLNDLIAKGIIGA